MLYVQCFGVLIGVRYKTAELLFMKESRFQRRFFTKTKQQKARNNRLFKIHLIKNILNLFS